MDIIDSIDLGTVDGFDIRAITVPDHDYAADANAATDSARWDWVGIIVTASRAGIELGSDSLWGVECERNVTNPLRDKDGTLDTYCGDMIENAVADARLKMTQLIDAAIDDSMGA
jgi:hypothetical protein